LATWRLMACQVLSGFTRTAATRLHFILAFCSVASDNRKTPEGAQPTRLASGCTLAQPDVLLYPLVGFYPTVSALTRSDAHIRWAGLLSVAVVVKRLCRRLPSLTVS
jgi:hypothetical protein